MPYPFYLTALAAVLHYFWKVKLDATNPIYYGVTVASLLSVRAWSAYSKKQLRRSS